MPRISRLVWLFPGLAAAAIAFAQPPAAPRLVVLIGVDQMRADYLDRFATRFSGGVRWLLDRGVVFTDAHHDHAITDTAAGHATITTGVHPARHGIVGDEYWDRREGQLVDSVRDANESIVGGNLRSGRSPVRLLRTGIGDWLKDGWPQSKVFSVSVKDRAAVFFAGKRPDAAYWLNRRNGDFVTSSYYRDVLPEWAAAFNAMGIGVQHYGAVWDMLLAAHEYSATRGDASPWEQGGANTAFPHRIGEPGGTPDLAFFTELISTPFADRYTIEFAMSLIEHESLGNDDVPDILFLGLSAADYIGHRYGPYSHEAEDYYLRLDGYLAELFARLDDAVGEGRYVVVLTADHGVASIPEPLALTGVSAARHEATALIELAAGVLAAAQAKGAIPTVPDIRFESNGLIFDFGDTAPQVERLAALQADVAGELRKQELVAAAYTYADLLAGGPSDDGWFAMFTRSFHPERAPDVMLRFPPNHLVDARATGTDHGSPYTYDTHVPLVLAGAGLKPVRRSERVHTVDVAPTLAALLGIMAPADLDGRPIDLR